ncbi:RNA-binding protein CP29B, chloroplastic [Manihot esculenta]|uniref:RNA-binding protein CP29B, chloroplastic n=1 Tax=Manihot esculenta TaxID=3983 RepID=UPI001CC58315|nr:RNA-binding protein CP29B, chloroplastic [Manihot esculenta]
MVKPKRGCLPPSGSGSGSLSRSRSKSRSRSYSGSDSRSSSRSWSLSSRSRSKSFSSSSSPSRSLSSVSRSPTAQRKSSAVVAKRGRSPHLQSRKTSPPRKISPIRESLVLHIGSLSRNVHEGHLKEIFSNFGEVVHVELAIDHTVNLPKGYGYVEFKARADAEKALIYMDGTQIDGNFVRARFTLPPRQGVSPPPKPIAAGLVTPPTSFFLMDSFSLSLAFFFSFCFLSAVVGFVSMVKPKRGRSPPSGSGSGSLSRSRSKSRSRSYSGSDSRSNSRSWSLSSRSRSKSFSSSSSPSRSLSSVSRSLTAQRKSSSIVAKNVHEGHLKEIFSNFGEVVHVELAIDHTINLPKGYGYVEFKARADAEKALIYMDGTQIDGNFVRARFTLPPRQGVSPPSKPIAAGLMAPFDNSQSPWAPSPIDLVLPRPLLYGSDSFLGSLMGLVSDWAYSPIGLVLVSGPDCPGLLAQARKVRPSFERMG